MLVTASFFCNRGMQTNLWRNFKLTKQNHVSNLTFSGIWNLCVYGSMQSPMLFSQCSSEYSHKCWVWWFAIYSWRISKNKHWSWQHAWVPCCFLHLFDMHFDAVNTFTTQSLLHVCLLRTYAWFTCMQHGYVCDMLKLTCWSLDAQTSISAVSKQSPAFSFLCTSHVVLLWCWARNSGCWWLLS